MNPTQEIQEIILTVKEIRKLALFAGLAIDDKKSKFYKDPKQIHTEIGIHDIRELVQGEINQRTYVFFDEDPTDFIKIS